MVVDLVGEPHQRRLRAVRGRVRLPTLYLEFSGDQAALPAVSARMFEALAGQDKVRHIVRGQHFGQPVAEGEPTGYAAAAVHIDRWLAGRFATAPQQRTR
ncbi:hypothetical protein LUX57_25430 [Actinomadura madurae]|uniref:hypothetical protein n=1 Tax=Actinomadura madurae TaxID=1993 RepID=UPI0020D23188|nr:hypothetical protein [Actinomadura madurae]MCP9968083.1 hypothetical protein [Actinomadura madurae]